MNKITIDSNTFKTLLRNATSCISKEKYYPHLQYIQGVVKDKKLTLTSTNGQILAKTQIELDIDGNINFEFYIKPFTIPKNVTAVEIENIEDTTTISLLGENINIHYQFSQTPDDFIHTDNIFPQTDNSLIVYFDAKRLIKALQPFTKMQSQRNITSFNFVREKDGINRRSPVTLSATQYGIRLDTLILPVTNK